jgi:DNA-binding transcriptional ArsR family regulator
VSDVAVIDDPSAAVVALDPRRSRLLAALAEKPASAAAVAAQVGLPRQQVGYHLTALRDHGLVIEVGQRHHGGITERILAASARGYVVSPAAMGTAGVDHTRVSDRFSAAYLVALAARAVDEVGRLLRGAERVGKRLPTLSIDTEVCFASADDRAACAAELAHAVRTIAARYHNDSGPTGRWYRIVAVSHPRLPERSPRRE